MDDRERIASRLRQAREAAKLTQEEVATVLGLPRPSISQIESGRRAVRSEELNKLAQLFGKPVGFFLGEREEEPLAVLFRAPEVKEEDRKLLEMGLTLCKKYKELEQILNMEPEDPLQFSGVARPRSKGEAIRHGEIIAKKARDLMKLGMAPIRDLAGLLEVNSVKVLRFVFRTEVSGAFAFSEELGACVFVNSGHAATRQNFTLAHEYCHTLLDWERRAQLDLNGLNKDKDPVETRADVFAAAFLMPEDALSQFFQRMGIAAPNKHSFGPYDVARIAAHFNASRPAVLWRLFNLKYIDTKTRDDLKEVRWSQVLGALGIRERDEPAEAPGKVSQERLRDMAVEAYRRGRISLGKLGGYLGLTLVQAKEFVHKAQIEPGGDEG
jgi:Zn-dependent peptidase ImmA (M78 family)/DNA-binding XRE family transcriptional regulator